MIDRCNKKGCKELGIYRVWLELHSTPPAQLYFPELALCEAHAREITWDKLIYPDVIAGAFQQMGKKPPDFGKTEVKLAVIQGAEVV